MKIGNEKGLTLADLIAGIFILVVAYLVISSALVKGNYWYSPEGVLRELKLDHPKVTTLLKTQRNVYSPSKIMVEEDSKRVTYCLDTDILWNYDFVPCE